VAPLPLDPRASRSFFGQAGRESQSKRFISQMILLFVVTKNMTKN
jgi:hypothetical protein